VQWRTGAPRWRFLRSLTFVASCWLLFFFLILIFFYVFFFTRIYEQKIVSSKKSLARDQSQFSLAAAAELSRFFPYHYSIILIDCTIVPMYGCRFSLEIGSRRLPSRSVPEKPDLRFYRVFCFFPIRFLFKSAFCLFFAVYFF